MNRRTLAGGLSLIAMVAVGCSSNDTAASRHPVDPAAVSGTITWWDTSDATNEAPAFAELTKRFHAKYPKITVNYVNVPFGAAESKFKTAAQAGRGAPDVMRADVGWTPTFASLGYLQALDGTAALTTDTDYLPGPTATTRFGGRTYGVPQVTDTLALLYNRKMLAQAGISKPPRTFDELEIAARAVERKHPGSIGFFVNADSYFLLPFVYGEGGDYVDVQRKKITVSSRPVLAGIQRARSLATNGVGRTDTSSNAYSNMQNAFKSGKVAMILNGPWSTADDLKGEAFRDPTNLGIADVPAGPQGQGGPTGGHNLVVYAGSANLQASYLFLQFANSAESQAYVASRNNTLPTRRSAYELPAVARNTILSQFQSPVRVSRPRPAAAGAGDLFNVLTPYMQKILSDQVPIQEGLNQAQQQAAPYVPGFSAG